MLWMAKYKDGTIIKQHEVGKHLSSKDLDRDKLDTFTITESSGDTTIQFSADSGVARFSNINYSKQLELEDKTKLTFVYNKEKETWVLDDESHKLYTDIMLLNEKNNYFYMEFNQTGRVVVNGQALFVGYNINGEDIMFANQPPYNDFQYLVSAQNDFLMGVDSVNKKTDSKTAYSLILNSEYNCEHGKFTLKYEIIYDVLKSYVMLVCDITCDTKIDGSFVLFMGGQRSAVPMNFDGGDTKQIRRILTMV